MKESQIIINLLYVSILSTYTSKIGARDQSESLARSRERNFTKIASILSLPSVLEFCIVRYLVEKIAVPTSKNIKTGENI